MVRTVQRVLPQAQLEEAGDLQQVLALARQGEVPDTLMLDLRFLGSIASSAWPNCVSCCAVPP